MWKITLGLELSCTEPFPRVSCLAVHTDGIEVWTCDVIRYAVPRITTRAEPQYLVGVKQESYSKWLCTCKCGEKYTYLLVIDVAMSVHMHTLQLCVP